MNNLLYQIGINLIPEIGVINAKNLISYCGSPEAVFSESKSALLKIPNIGPITAHQILNQKILFRAEKEIDFIQKNNIQTTFYLDKKYPNRLLQCYDAPILLYYKGNLNLNPERAISIIGTRNATEYGRNICRKLIKELGRYNVTIISGLAYGIDICAHKESIKNNIKTIGVLAHGLDQIYPSSHRNTANSMLSNGGLITEFLSQTKPQHQNFPKRNRIVAGLCDATIIVESANKGGSLITAEYANNYNRDVFAVPGKLTDPFSEGCNKLIRTNKAHLLESVENIAYLMNWEEQKKSAKKEKQTDLFNELSEEEILLLKSIASNSKITIDQLCSINNINMGKASNLLLNLEFKGHVKSLPGKLYTTN